MACSLHGLSVILGADADASPKKVGDYGLAEKVMALRFFAKQFVDKGIIAAQVLYNAADTLAHDMLDAFPSGGLMVPATLASYKSKVPGFVQRADAINEQFKANGYFDVYARLWKPVFDPWQDKMLSGDYEAAKDAAEAQAVDTAKAGLDAVKKKLGDAIDTAKWYTKTTYWVLLGAGALAITAIGVGVGVGARHRISGK